MNLKRLVILLLMGIPLIILGQAEKKTNKKISRLSIALTNESIALPFTRYSPIHPGAEVGMTFWEKNKTRSSQRWNAVLGGYYHQRVETAFYLQGQYQYQWFLLPYLGVDLTGGLGYLHSFYPADLYEQNATTGKYQAVSQIGRPHGIAELGLGLTFTNSSRIEPYIRQSMMVEAPFANGIPVIPHSFLKVGVNVKL
jgi:hypothetical protein